jgi:hypothetical protein
VKKKIRAGFDLSDRTIPLLGRMKKSFPETLSSYEYWNCILEHSIATSSSIPWSPIINTLKSPFSGFHKLRRVCWRAKQVLAPQEGLCCTDLSYLVSLILRNTKLYLGADQFESRLGHQLYWRLQWCSLVPPGKCRDRTSHYVITDSFHILSNSLLIKSSSHSTLHNEVPTTSLNNP